MRELIRTRGIEAIEIGPFDGAPARNRNQFITAQDSDEALQPVRKLRDTFGSEIEIAVRFYAQWKVTSAIRLAHSLQPYRPLWLEDQQYRELAASTSLPPIAGERMAGKMQFEQLPERNGRTDRQRGVPITSAFICGHIVLGDLCRSILLAADEHR